jgi:hypothetical protein
MVWALEAGNKELSSQMVKDFLLGDEQRDEQNEKLSALWTRNNNHHRFNKSRHKKEDNGNQSNNKPDLWWLKCRKSGHTRKGCPEKEKPEKSEGDNSGKQKMTAIFTALGVKAKLTKWTLDIACNNHMSYRKAWMNDYRIDKSLEVSVANNAVEIGGGMGNICVNLLE